MGRKVNCVGTGTLTLSLPRDWVIRHRIGKGDELNVLVAKDGSLVVSPTELKEAGLVMSLDSSSVPVALERILAGFYKAGYSQIELSFSKPEFLDRLQALLQKTFIGFELVHIGKQRVVIKQVSRIMHEEFDDMYRRLWIVLVGFGDEVLQAYSSGDRSKVVSAMKRHELINRYADFCRRAINMRSVDFDRPGPRYTIIEMVEKVSYQYLQLLDSVGRERFRPSAQVIDMLGLANDYLSKLRSVVFDYDLKKMDRFIAAKQGIDLRLSEIKTSQKDGILSYHCRQIVQLLFYFNSPVSTLHS